MKWGGLGVEYCTEVGATTIKFICDQDKVILERDGSDNAVVSQRRGDTTKYYHFDALGSTLALTDTNENVTDTYRYYAFGQSLTSSGATINNFRFVGNLGYYNEAALALQYLRAR